MTSKGIMNGMIGRAGVSRTSSALVQTSSYLRDTRSGVISARPAVLRDSRDDIRVAWRRSAALALDIMHNSGRLKGAADQVLADTVGVELQLRPKPSLDRLGYDDKETAEFVALVKDRWKKWAWNARECDLRGKFTVPQMIDIGLRWGISYGEITGVMSYMSSAERRRYGIRTGTKVCMVAPARLVQDTSEYENLFQGIRHDENNRAVSYRFNERQRGRDVKVDYPAFDRDGRPVVIHIFDPVDGSDVRGISKLAPAFRKHIQHEMLEDATLQQAILQTVFAIVLTSPSPSVEAFEAIEALKDTTSGTAAKSVANDFLAYFSGAMERAQEGKIHVSGDPQISHLAPGEELDMKGLEMPGGSYAPFSASLSRDMARALGITYGGLTMDHTDATYSSVRMETASIWPVVMRRREREAAPLSQTIYENWLDEEIGEGRIPFKGGYEAFAANRDEVCWAQWQGPPKPTADDLKSAKAQSERLENGTSSLSIEAAEAGIDPDELFEDRQREHQRYVDAGMRSPFEPRAGRDRSNEADPKRSSEAA